MFNDDLRQIFIKYNVPAEFSTQFQNDIITIYNKYHPLEPVNHIQKSRQMQSKTTSHTPYGADMFGDYLGQ